MSENTINFYIHHSPANVALMLLGYEEHSSEKIKKLMKAWKKNFSNIVLPNLQALLRMRVIRPIHLPLHCSLIFKIYLAERIELYQLQLSKRDFELDNRLKEIEKRIAESLYQDSLINVSQKENLLSFVELIDEKMGEYKIKDVDFLDTSKAWIKILSIAYISDLRVYDILNKKPNHEYLDKIPVPINREILESACVLLIKEFAESYEEAISAYVEVLSQETNERIKELFFSIALVFRDLDELKDLINQYRKLCFEFVEGSKTTCWQDQESVKNNFDRLVAIFDFHDKHLHLDLKKINKSIAENFKNSGVRQPFVFRFEKSDRIIKASRSETQKLIEFCEAVQKVFVTFQFCTTYTCHLKPLLLELYKAEPSNRPFSPESLGFVEEDPPSSLSILETEPTSKTPKLNVQVARVSKKRKGKKQGNKNKKATAQAQTPKQITMPQIKLQSKEPVLVKAAESPRTFVEQLCALHGSTRSVFLEQAVWHMERMVSLKTTLETDYPQMTLQQKMTAFVALAASSHKLLEQLYNFSLAKQGRKALSGHNLKTYHQELYRVRTYPEIVKQLYNASNWTRYFIDEENRLNQMTTYTPHIPQLVLEFSQFARGSEPASLLERTQKIFNDTISYSAEVLFQAKLPTGVYNANSPLTLPPLSLENLAESFTLLENVVTSLNLHSTAATSLCFKQALANLSMLKAGLEQWNETQTTSELVTWTSWSLHQMQEVLENALRGIADLRGQAVTGSHELQEIAKQLGFEMGALGEEVARLSWKPRYPIQFSNIDGTAAQLIDDANSLYLNPELAHGFTQTANPSSKKIADAVEKQPISLPAFSVTMQGLMNRSMQFLNKILTQEK